MAKMQELEVKQYEDLDFTDNFMFCKILQNNPNLCKELTELILDRKIGNIISLNKQMPIEITSDGRGVRFDVYLEDDASTVYDIEMQTYREADLPKRARYYQAMIDLNMSERGIKYKDLKCSYVIFICLKNPFGQVGRHKYTIRSACVEEPSLEFGDEAYRIILSAEGDQDDVSEEMKQFLYYLTTRKAESDLTRKLEEEVIRSRNHKEWRMEYMTLLERRDERNIEKGIGIGEEMFVRLIQVLTEKGLQSEIDAVLKDKGYREVLYKKYGIK